METANLWGEKNLIELTKNCENNPTIVPNDTIREIKTELNQKECEDIGNEKKKWMKKCPECGQKQIFTYYSGLYKAIKRNSMCVICRAKNQIGKIGPNLGRRFSEETKKKLSLLRKGKQKTEEHKKKISLAHIGKKKPPFSQEWKNNLSKSAKGKRCGDKNPMFGKTVSNEIRYKISLKLRGEKSFWYGKTRKNNPNYKQRILTEDGRKKLREYAINRIKKVNGVITSYNKNACDFINVLNDTYKWNLQHALNGGEFCYRGYFADGYDKINNIWFEYDEPKHNKKKQQEKDLYRMEEIKKYLNCTFIRYNERDDNLYII